MSGACAPALVLLGPLGIFGFSALAFVIPELSRRDLNRRRTLQVAFAISSVLVLAAVLWSAALLALPARVGSQLLGDTWHRRGAVLPGMVVWQLGTVAAFGAGGGHNREGLGTYELSYLCHSRSLVPALRSRRNTARRRERGRCRPRARPVDSGPHLLDSARHWHRGGLALPQPRCRIHRQRSRTPWWTWHDRPVSGDDCQLGLAVPSETGSASY